MPRKKTDSRTGETAATIKESIAERKRRISRTLEYRRLRRYRRKEVPGYTRCRNCGEELKGMYCHRCGQYALDIEQPFWKYLLQYFENVYQFDGKVWTTLWMLFRRPGYLTTEFCAGKIVSYVHPMKLLMFITVVFFLFFFMFYGEKLDSALGSSTESMNEHVALNEMINEGIVLDGTETDTVRIAIVADSSLVADYGNIFRIEGSAPYRISTDAMDRNDEFWKDTLTVTVPGRFHETTAYENIGEWHGIPLFRFNNSYKASVSDKFNLFKERIIGAASGYAPLTALLLIPLLALMLNGIYRKCRIPYMGHFVFSLHFASFFFIVISVYLAAGELWHYEGFPLTALILLILAYMTIASHTVYRGTGWIKATVKSAVVLTAYFITVAIIILMILAYLVYAEKDVLMEAIS